MQLKAQTEKTGSNAKATGKGKGTLHAMMAASVGSGCLSFRDDELRSREGQQLSPSLQSHSCALNPENNIQLPLLVPPH